MKETGNWDNYPRLIPFAEQTQQILGLLDLELSHFVAMKDTKQFPMHIEVSGKRVTVRTKRELGLLRDIRNLLAHGKRDLKPDGSLIVQDLRNNRVYHLTREDIEYLLETYKAFRHVMNTGEGEFLIKCATCDMVGDASLPLICGHIEYEQADLTNWKFPMFHRPSGTIMKGELKFWKMRPPDMQKDHENKLSEMLKAYEIHED